MIKLFKGKDFELLQSWITDAELMFQFAGESWKYPLTKADFEAYRAAFPKRYFYIGYTNKNEPFAFGEIITNETNSPRLGRLLIGNPKLRGQGLGQKFIRELIDECVKLTSTKEIFLFVFENNISAIKCYEKLGFRFTDDFEARLNYKGEAFKVLKMRLEINS